MSNYPPGVSERDIQGSQCPICGTFDGCDCEPDDDPRTWRERGEENKGERDFDYDQNEP